MTHPRVYPHISDDSCPPREDFQPHVGDPLIYVGVFNDKARFMGLFLFHPHNAITFEVHTCLLPIAWGSLATECTKAAAAWMWANTPCRRIVTNVPAYNMLALALAERSGMERYGVNPKSFLKDGALHDQIMLGMSKE